MTTTVLQQHGILKPDQVVDLAARAGLELAAAATLLEKESGGAGVGPTQLTLPAFQDRADARGGCHDWAVNARVGFEILSAHISAHGFRGGFRAYNGSGDAAETYADDAVGRLGVWRQRLHGPMDGGPLGERPVLRVGDVGALVGAVQRFMNSTFPLYSHIDLAPRRYGPQTASVIAEFQHRAGLHGHDVDPAGRMIAQPTWSALEHFGFH